LTLGIIILISSLFIYLVPLLNPPKVIQPGGVWGQPADNQLIKGTIHFTARAYPSNQDDPPISLVRFAIFWPGLYYLKTACASTVPNADGYYTCDAALSKFGAPLDEKIEISFDVLDQQDNITLAPNGIRTIIYSP